MPYTSHGHWYGPGEPTQPGPRLRAKCFGLGGCYDCRTQAGLSPLPEPNTTPETITVYISIGNSDDKLTQHEWSLYAFAFADELKRWASRIHGFWHSLPDSPFQNANACVEIAVGDVESVRRMLARLAADHRQDSIAWAVAPTTEFIRPAEAVSRG